MHLKILDYMCKVKILLLRLTIYGTENRKRQFEFEFSHITYYACSNVGDTVLSDTVRRGFDLTFSDIKWKLYNVTKPVNSITVKNYNKTDAVIIGGGGLFLPDTNENSMSGWQWPCNKELMNQITVPVILYAVGFNYFRTQVPEELFVESLVKIIDKCSFAGIRNHGSIREISKLLPNKLKGKLKYQPCLTTIVRKLGYNLPEKAETKSVAFNVAFDRLDIRLGNNKEIILQEIALSMKRIQSKGYRLFYIAHIIKDLEFVPYIRKYEIKASIINASGWTTERLIRFYNTMDLVVGMRGHAQMIPFGVNCHIITLGSHNKMKWFLEDIEAMDWYIELQHHAEGLSDIILKKFVLIHEKNALNTSQRIIDAQEKLYRITIKNFKEIKCLIKKEHDGGNYV